MSINATVSNLEGAGRFLLGTRNSARTDTFATLVWTDNKVAGGYGNSGIYQSEIVQAVDDKFNLTLDKNLLYHNNSLIKTFDTQQFTSENNLWIGTLNNNGSPSQGLQGKIYSCKIWDNGTLIRDYIPCKRNSDNKIGLYDIVNNTFSSSPNNYSFTAGNEASIPSPDYPQTINNVTGDVEVVVSNSDNTKLQTFTFPLGNEKLMLGDYLADDGIHHKTRELNLAIADMNNDENYPGWKNLSQLKTDYPSISDSFTAAGINYKSNISNEAYRFRLNTLYEGVIWLPPSNWGNIKQTQWKTNYPNLILKFQYELKEEEVVPYTSAQQEVYNQIKQALSYEEQTNISGTSDGSNPIFNVEVYQNTKLVLQDISNAIVALGGV